MGARAVQSLVKHQPLLLPSPGRGGNRAMLMCAVTSLQAKTGCSPNRICATSYKIDSRWRLYKPGSNQAASAASISLAKSAGLSVGA